MPLLFSRSWMLCQCFLTTLCIFFLSPFSFLWKKMRKPLSKGQFRRGGAGNRDWNRSRARTIYPLKFFFYRGNRLVKENLFHSLTVLHSSCWRVKLPEEEEREKVVVVCVPLVTPLLCFSLHCQFVLIPSVASRKQWTNGFWSLRHTASISCVMWSQVLLSDSYHTLPFPLSLCYLSLLFSYFLRWGFWFVFTNDPPYIGLLENSIATETAFWHLFCTLRRFL